MKTKREYEEAFDLIDIFTSCGCNEVDDCNCCIAYDKGLKQQHGCELDLALNMFKELIEEHLKLLDVIKEEVDNIQTVIDLLDSKVLTMGHINVAIKKLEIIQDKLMGVKEDVE